MTYHPELRGLEHAAELEKPFAVAGVAYAAADKEGSQGRFCQEACSNIVREVTAGGQTIHLSDLISSDGESRDHRCGPASSAAGSVPHDPPRKEFPVRPVAAWYSASQPGSQRAIH